MDPAQYQSRNPYLALTGLLRATGHYKREMTSAERRDLVCHDLAVAFCKKLCLQHFYILKRQLLSQNVFQLRNCRASSEFSKSFRFLLKPCSDLMLGVTLRAPPLNTPKSILLPFTLTSWGSFLRAKAVRISNNSHYIQANRHPSHSL